jgi:hypothetical protein
MRAITRANAFFLIIALMLLSAEAPSLAQPGKDKQHPQPPATRPAPQPAQPAPQVRPPTTQLAPSFRRPTAVPSYRPVVPSQPHVNPRPTQQYRPSPVPSVRPNAITPRSNIPGSMLNPNVRPTPNRPGIPPNTFARPDTFPRPNATTPRPGQPNTVYRPPNVTNPLRPGINDRNNVFRPPNAFRPGINVPLDRNWPNRGATVDNRWENWRHSGNWNDFTRQHSTVVRNNFNNFYTANRYGPMFTPNWYRDSWQHGYFWNYQTPTPWYWWNYGTIPLVNNWLAWNAATPLYYNYGDNFLYQDGIVYYNQQPLGPVETYITQAEQLALSGVQALANATELEWLPLGVFALTHGEQSEPTMFVQLAVTKSGLIGGTYRNTTTNEIQTVSGKVDPSSQRAAWTIGDSPSFVMEAGIYNLTQDVAPVLMHWGTDLTQTWLMTRVPAPAQ